jgi:spore coat polysaccharide biosynthesis protein SpsF
MNQEDFWKGDFGTDYISRNIDETLLESNVNFFEKILQNVQEPIDSILELGANVGMNFLALSRILPNLNFTGVEINKAAADALRETGCEVHNCAIQDLALNATYDLVLTKTVLIHIAPEKLPDTYEKIFNFSRKWILIAEYYNSTPTGIPYRGHEEKLFKRDFAGEMLDTYPSLKLVDYGFTYHRDSHPQDDVSWFLLRKD